jgi:hypothetical protein
LEEPAIGETETIQSVPSIFLNLDGEIQLSMKSVMGEAEVAADRMID